MIDRTPSRDARSIATEQTLPVLYTLRLTLRPVTEDLSPMIALNSDSQVMRFILGRAAAPEETRSEWHRRLTRQSDPARGLGYWAGFEDEEFVGWWSAAAIEGRSDAVEVGYRLRAAAWGRGLATEGAHAMIEQSFTSPAVQRIVASTMAINTASRRVLEKVGMAHTSTWWQDWPDPIPGSEDGEVGYELVRSSWNAR